MSMFPQGFLGFLGLIFSWGFPWGIFSLRLPIQMFHIEARACFIFIYLKNNPESTHAHSNYLDPGSFACSFFRNSAQKR